MTAIPKQRDPYSRAYLELLDLMGRLGDDYDVPAPIEDMFAECLDALWFALGDAEKAEIERSRGPQRRVRLHGRRQPPE